MQIRITMSAGYTVASYGDHIAYIVGGKMVLCTPSTSHVYLFHWEKEEGKRVAGQVRQLACACCQGGWTDTYGVRHNREGLGQPTLDFVTEVVRQLRVTELIMDCWFLFPKEGKAELEALGLKLTETEDVRNFGPHLSVLDLYSARFSKE